jgi:Tfp pilus assembly protein PilN
MAQIGLGIFLVKGQVTLATVKRAFRNSKIEAIKSYPLKHSDLLSEQSIAEVSMQIRSFISQHSLKPTYAAMSIDHGDYLWSNIEMPPVSKQDLRKLMQYELELHVPVDPNSIYFDIVPSDDAVSASSRVVLITSPQSIIDRYSEMIHQAGQKLRSIEPSPYAWWRYLKLGKNITESSGFQTVLAFRETREKSSVGILLLRNGLPVLFREVRWDDPWGRTGTAAPEEQEDTRPGGTTQAHQVVNEIRVAYFGMGQPDTQENHGEILVLGDPPAWWNDQIKAVPGDIQWTPVSLKTQLGTNVTTLDEIAAVGIALVDPEDDLSVNLLPKERRPIQRHVGMMVTGILAGLLISLSGVLTINAFWKTDLNLLQTKTKITAMEKPVNHILAVKEQLDDVKGKFDFFRKLHNDYPTQLQILRELTQILPDADTETESKVYLESYDYEGNEIGLKGRSSSPEGLINLLEESPLFEKVQFDGTVSGESFRIKATVSKYQDMEEDPGMMDDDDDGSGDEAGTDVDIPSPTPGDGKANRDSQDLNGDDSDESFEFDAPRGPAFPRDKGVAGDEEPVEKDVEEPDISSPQNGERSEEEIEKMKENLLSFIRDHKEEGNIVERDRDHYEEPDPEEAAANFLEFLKSASENNDGASQEGE